jgi:predicted transcriptional regulator
MTNKNEVKKSNIEKSRDPLVVRLMGLGFTSAESEVYLQLLRSGKELGGGKIALITQMHRQYVYIALPKLISNGLVEEVGFGKRKKYKARPPEELEKIARKKALEAGDLARELHLISNIASEQEFEVLQGVRAIREYELIYAERVEGGSEEYILGGATEQFSSLMGEDLHDYLHVKKKKQLIVKYLGTPDETIFYQDVIGKYDNQEYKFLARLPKGKTHMVIRKDTVSFFSFLTPPLVYIIKSEEVAKHYKEFFMMLWNMA